MNIFSLINAIDTPPLSHQKDWQIKWDDSILLPLYHNGEKNKGVAGAFSGFVGDTLIIAGGANFPDKMPWEGGKKNWDRTLYFADTGNTDLQWGVMEDFLPEAVAYGISIQLHEGLLCIGGCNREQCFDNVFLISKEDGTIRISHDWPSLPVPLANATGALLNDKIYIAGGQENMNEENATDHFFVLDLNHKEKGWLALPSWDGDARGFAVGVACADGENQGFYLFGGRNYRSTGYVEILTDGHVYNPHSHKWIRLQETFPVMAGTAFTLGEEIVFLGGVTKLLPGSYEHPGFENIIRVYSTVSNVFVNVEILPFPVPVTTNIAIRESNIFITSGEIRPGIRTPSIYKGQITPILK